MINRLCFVIIVIIEGVAFFTTLVPLYVQYQFNDEASLIQQLDNLEQSWETSCTVLIKCSFIVINSVLIYVNAKFSGSYYCVCTQFEWEQLIIISCLFARNEIKNEIKRVIIGVENFHTRISLY